MTPLWLFCSLKPLTVSTFLSGNFQLMNLSSLRKHKPSNGSIYMFPSLCLHVLIHRMICSLLLSLLSLYFIYFIPCLSVSPLHCSVKASSSSFHDAVFLVIAPFLCSSSLSNFSKELSGFCLHLYWEYLLSFLLIAQCDTTFPVLTVFSLIAAVSWVGSSLLFEALCFLGFQGTVWS